MAGTEDAVLQQNPRSITHGITRQFVRHTWYPRAYFTEKDYILIAVHWTKICFLIIKHILHSVNRNLVHSLCECKFL
jgi:hypothetical protein